MNILLRTFSINIFLSLVEANLIVSKIAMRPPKENDIGLIFDISVTNLNQNNQRERLQFSIRSAEGCKLDLGNSRSMENAGRIVGGFFGCIEPSSSETVSVIWPTVSLYNRVGCCPIVITTTNLNDQQSHVTKLLSFDTKYETLDPQQTGLRKSKNYKDCKNFDLDYMNNCKPVDCGRRYFGLRNFFCENTKQCDPSPPCKGEVLYDPFTNECIDGNLPCSKKDIRDIKRGEFKKYADWTKEISSRVNSNGTKYAKRETVYNEDISLYDSKTVKRSLLKGTLDGLMLVFATIGIYVIICFGIFLIVSAVSRRQGAQKSLSFSAPPSVSERGIPIRSHLSLVSRR